MVVSIPGYALLLSDVPRSTGNGLRLCEAEPLFTARESPCQRIATVRAVITCRRCAERQAYVCESHFLDLMRWTPDGIVGCAAGTEGHDVLALGMFAAISDVGDQPGHVQDVG
jgi:hypothetical protein